MIKIFTDEFIFKGKRLKLDSYNLHHLKVAGAHPGTKILVGGAEEKEFVASLEKDFTLLMIQERASLARPSFELTLFAALLKKQKYEEIIFSCTQLGVSEFIPVITGRTIKNIKSNALLKTYRRWEKKARHGAELSKREKIPKIRKVIPYEAALEIYKSDSYKKGILLYEQADQTEIINSSAFRDKTALFVGPEGGFKLEEVDEAKKAGLNIKTLGPLILDSMTACIAGVSALLHGCYGKRDYEGNEAI